MDEETKEQVVALLARVGMMAEDLSAIAVGAAGVSGEELTGLVAELQRRVGMIKELGEEAASINDFGHFQP